MALRSFTKLAPLGDKTNEWTGLLSIKATNLPASELAAMLSRDLTAGATGKGSYILTGDLDESIFMNSCTFVDPTNRVDSVQQYKKALTLLFDPTTSHVDLIEPLRAVDEHTIAGRYRCWGSLQLPWRPVVRAFESDIVYKINERNGLIAEQRQSWSKSAYEALGESFTPGIFYPPPVCTLPRPKHEPALVTRLFDKVNGRRSTDYSTEERNEIDAWIDGIDKNLNVPFRSDLLSGKWMLVYLRPGSSGAGIDRRVPFPEFPFNNNFQLFQIANRDNREGTITNLGELWGPSLYVSVGGDLRETAEEEGAKSRRKGLQATIRQGRLCWVDKCLDLPISGEGLFESVFLGERLRIGQNINGGGALVVQVRVK
jgi:hypothetical protein